MINLGPLNNHQRIQISEEVYIQYDPGDTWVMVADENWFEYDRGGAVIITIADIDKLVKELLRIKEALLINRKDMRAVKKGASMNTWIGSVTKDTWFHWQDGWFFKRLPDGSVQIEKRETAHEDSPLVVGATIPATQWASIVSAVSQFGDFMPFYEMALVFHGLPVELLASERHSERKPPESGQDSADRAGESN